MRRFDPEQYYRPSDDAMRVFGSIGTLSQWRHYGRGPAFIRFGNRILYSGKMLNEYLDEHIVAPANQAA